MNKLDPTQITKAPLMAKTERMGSTEALSIYLNNQADTLHSLLVHYGKVLDRADHVRILDFDDHGFDVDYTLPYSDEPELERRTRIDFEKPITRWADLRPTMLGMRDEAKRALEIPRNPDLPAFQKPDLLPELFVVGVLLVFQALAAIASESSLFELRQEYLPGGWQTVKWSYAVLVGAHVAESVWFVGYLRREGSVRKEDIKQWVLWTLAFGLLTTWPNYQRRLQEARVEGIYARVEREAADHGNGKAKRRVEGKKQK